MRRLTRCGALPGSGYIQDLQAVEGKVYQKLKTLPCRGGGAGGV